MKHLFEKITAKIDKIVLLFVVFVLGVSFYFVYSLNLSYRKRDRLQSLDNALLLTKNMLEEEEQHALSLSLLLAQDKAFLESFYGSDRESAFKILNRKIETLAKLQGYRFEVQVHDAHLHTYLRSWDFSIKDVPLASFREGLVLVKKLKKPLVSIEVGKRLNIKAISPIMQRERFMGSIEVIEGFAHLKEKLAEEGYALMILLDKKYLSVATTLQHHPLVDGAFVLVDSVYDHQNFDALNTADLSGLGSYGYFTRGAYAYGYFEIKNYHNDRLGYCIVSEKAAETLPASYHEESYHDTQSGGITIR